MIDPQQVREALFAGELFLEYLPSVALADGRSVGCEALVRWRQHDRVVMPMEFIPAIENTPVSGLLTYWVLDTAGRELGQWLHTHAEAHLAINVPPEILGRGGLEYAAYKANLLAVRNRVVLEITERGIPDQLGLEELRQMAASDVMIAMDDVALDSANLLLLSRMPVDLIKLDCGFVAKLDASDACGALERLRALIGAGRHLVVAEGVEREEQARLLRDAGVQFAQGWLYSKPLSAADFIAWHARRNARVGA